ncbi:hypothetical protein [Spirosoma aerophilum]
MTIDTSAVNLTLDSVIMTEQFGAVITLELRTMKGEPHKVHLNQCFGTRLASSTKPNTLGDLISLIMRRQHPQIQYIAELNGIKVTHYHERPSLSQSFSQIGYSS